LGSASELKLREAYFHDRFSNDKDAILFRRRDLRPTGEIGEGRQDNQMQLYPEAGERQAASASAL